MPAILVAQGLSSYGSICSCPLSVMVTFFDGGVPFKASTFRTTSMPSTTFPNTTCLPSSHDVLTVHMKNWDPFVSFPALAIDRIPVAQCVAAGWVTSKHLPLNTPNSTVIGMPACEACRRKQGIGHHGGSLLSW